MRVSNTFFKFHVVNFVGKNSPEIKKKTQKAVDAAIKVTDPIMVKYLKARFALRNKDCPHLMKF